MGRVIAFLKKEFVLCAAAVLAVVSMFFVPPSAEYIDYIDFRVLGLLFCLMAVVAGFRRCGLFEVLAQRLLAGRESFRAVCVLLVLLPFFCSMLVTNDVSLIAFVPFAIFVLDMLGKRGALIRVVVLQTVAANLGSMATPVGNPQNLYLFDKLPAGDFFALVLPLAGVSFLGLLLCAALGGKGEIQVSFPEKARVGDKKRLALYAVLFLACLLCVFRVIPWLPLTVAVALALALAAPSLLREVDYALLLTFVCFFIFSGNLGKLDAVHALLSGVLEKNTLLASAGVSQVISNVPAAVLLSGLTDNVKALLAGVDVGGLGTPVASLASLISLKLYLATPGHKAGRYLLVFTLANVIGLAVLLPLAALLV